MTNYPLENKRVWVAGHKGMVGSALCRRLQRENIGELLTIDRVDVDLRDQSKTARWIKDNKPDAIFLSAAKVGGILANDSRPADFIYDNLMIAANVVHAAHEAEIEKLLFLGSSCIYPKLAPQPIPENALMTGPLEPTNEAYAIAKIAGLKLCDMYRRQHGRDFISAMPTNLYGPGDNYHPENSHVIPGLIRRIHEAKTTGLPSVRIWGSGKPQREFLHVDDCADALVHVMQNWSEAGHINVGTGQEISIAGLARLIKDVIGFGGELEFDLSKPDGTPRKLLDCRMLSDLGWTPGHSLLEGLTQTYQWFIENNQTLRK